MGDLSGVCTTCARSSAKDRKYQQCAKSNNFTFLVRSQQEISRIRGRSYFTKPGTHLFLIKNHTSRHLTSYVIILDVSYHPWVFFYRYTVLLNKIQTLLGRSTFVQDSLLAADATEYPADGLVFITTLPIFIPET